MAWDGGWGSRGWEGRREPLPLVTSGALLVAALRAYSLPFLRRRRGPVAATLAALAVVPWLRLLASRWEDYSRRVRQRHLLLTSPLHGSTMKQAIAFGLWALRRWPWSLGPDRWRGFCPCCKRPIEAYLSERWRPTLPKPEARGRYAYLICLWGASPAYLVGAMVLGYSIKKTGSKHARVCLYTDDVPSGYISILSELWDCRPIEHVDAVVRTLSFSEKEDRFEKVFTKLRGMELTEFAKVLMMDIDLLVRSNIDELFELPAPAAMRRGMNDRHPYRHGDTLDGRAFFLGHDNTKWAWGQGTGINAGVMLWQPDEDVFKEMLSEIQEPNHPEHCKGNGPEQDFLSRYWADSPWTHVGVEFNFQLHQMFFAIHPDRADRAERATLLADPDQIKIVHYSGEPTAKPWHRVLDSKFADFWPDRSRDDEYAELYADEFMGHWLWVRRDRATFETAANNNKNWDMEGMYLDERGEIYRKSWAEGEPPEHLEVPEAAARGAVNFLRTVLKEWFDTLQELEAELGFEVRERLAAVAGEAVPPAVPLVAPAEPGSTGGTDAEEPAPALQGQAVASTPTALVRPGSQQFSWRRHGGRGGWWTECEEKQSGCQAFKASVVCGATANSRFVAFVEAGVGTFDDQDPELEGLFVKVAGPHSARRFRMPSSQEDGGLEQALVPVHLWVDSVPPGATVLVALLCVAPQALATVLGALAPLGVPQVPPPRAYEVLAAVGQRPLGGGAVGSGTKGFFSKAGAEAPGGEGAYASHASRDVAYAAALVAEPA